MSFFWNNSKNIDIAILGKNKTYSEVNYMCVYQIWSKLIEKWPPKIQDGRHEI